MTEQYRNKEWDNDYGKGDYYRDGNIEMTAYNNYNYGGYEKQDEVDGMDSQSSSGSSTGTYESDSEGSSDYEEKKLTLYQACGLNTMNMFGTGPFITVPFVIAAADPPGPHALIGYALAAFACMNDSLIWAELGSMWPDSGGSYVYLRELFGRHTWGRLIAFLFVWQIMVSGPMECASGFIATAQYVAFISETYTYEHHSLIAFAMCLLTVWALYREIDDIGTITLVLWAFTIAAILFTVVAGYLNFNPEYIAIPAGAFDDGARFFVSLGVAARFAVYDFTGYYDVNFVGNEVQNPKHTIPVACVTTCCVVAMVFFLVDIALIGSLEWRPDHFQPETGAPGYVKAVKGGDNSANYIMATFCNTHVGYEFAVFFTCIVAITIFGSCFSFMVGLAQIPYTAAKDGYFYHFLSHQHATYKGLSDYSLLFVGLLSTVFCFVDLEIVIEGMLTMQLLIQFMSQGFGLMYYRYLVHPDDQEEAGFPVPLFPIPNIIQLVIFGFIFATTENLVAGGKVPLLEVAMAFIVSGIIMYLLWARKNGFWPYAYEELDSDEEFMDHLIVYVAEEGFDDEFALLKKKLLAKDNQIHALQNNSSTVYTLVKEKDIDINNATKALVEKDFRIIQLTRTLDTQDDKVKDLYSELSTKEKSVTEAKMENAELQRRLQELQVRFGIPNINESMDYSPSIERNIDDDSVLNWTVADVITWWRNNLPKGAQEFVPVVEECHLTGKDLVELDSEMLEQIGIKKLLVMKILKSIEPLRASVNLSVRIEEPSDTKAPEPPRKGYEHEENQSQPSASNPIQRGSRNNSRKPSGQGHV